MTEEREWLRTAQGLSEALLRKLGGMNEPDDRELSQFLSHVSQLQQSPAWLSGGARLAALR